MKYYLMIGAALAGTAVVGLFLIALRLVLFVDDEVVIMGISMTGS